MDEDLTSEIELVHEKMIQVDVITFVGADNNFKLQPLSAPFGLLYAGKCKLLIKALLYSLREVNSIVKFHLPFIIIDHGRDKMNISKCNTFRK